ncbi:MAG: hypothetical protein WDA75_06590 [Candidatus Latescibacterota bacterium]|jgi:hypothetical protein
MELFVFVIVVLVMLLGFVLYTALAATFFISVPFVFRYLRRHDHPPTPPPAG